MKIAVRIVAVLLTLILILLLVPSSTPIAIGEEIVYPLYSEVELGASEIEPLDFSNGTPYSPIKSAFLPDNAGYLDDTLSVRIEKMRAYDTTIMLVWVQIADASQMRTELCKPFPSKATARADTIAKRVKAVLAINGDYFVYHNQGYVVRNGKVLREKYNDSYDTLLIDDHGDFTIIQHTTKEKIDAFEGNIMQAMTFGPGLVVNGVVTTEFPLKSSSPKKETQRLGIAQMGQLSYLIVATEGPENKGSTGLTMAEFAQLMADLGANNAYNLDGGSSSTVVLNYKKINALSTHKIRAIGDILYFVTAQDGEAK